METITYSDAAQWDELYAEDNEQLSRERDFFYRLFEWHAERTITDEQVQRVLTPVLAKINAGDYDLPKHHPNLHGTLYVMAACVVLVGCMALSITFFYGGQAKPDGILARSSPLVTIESREVPLAGSPQSNSLSGSVVLDGRDVDGVLVRLVNETTGDVAAVTQTDESGAYLFEGFPDGIYRVEVALPADGVEDTHWVEADSALNRGRNRTDDNQVLGSTQQKWGISDGNKYHAAAQPT